MTITKKSLSTIVAAVGVLVPTAAAMAPTASAFENTAGASSISAGITLPSASNPTAQFKTTGVASKTSSTKTTSTPTSYQGVPRTTTDTTTTTKITYTNGDVQTIVDTHDKGFWIDDANKTDHFVHNTTTMPNGAQVAYEHLDTAAEDLRITYVAHTKTYTNVRDNPRLDGGKVLTVLAPNATVKVTDFSNTWSLASNTQIDTALKNSSNPDRASYIADSTLNFTPLS